MFSEASGIIFRRSLRDSRRGIIGWGVGLAVLAIWLHAFYPALEDVLEAFGRMLEIPLVKGLVGNVEDFATLQGWIGLKMLNMLPLITAFYVVLAALGMVSGEEERGTLDILLSTPAPRWMVVFEKYAALTVALLIINGLFMAGLAAGSLLLGDIGLRVDQIIAGAVNMVPVTLFMAALTLLLTTIQPIRRHAGTLAAAIIIASYFMTTLSDLAGENFAFLKQLSFFNYYQGETVLSTGLIWGNMLVLVAGAAVMLLLSIFFFQHRDLGT